MTDQVKFYLSLFAAFVVGGVLSFFVSRWTAPVTQIEILPHPANDTSGFMVSPRSAVFGYVNGKLVGVVGGFAGFIDSTGDDAPRSVSENGCDCTLLSGYDHLEINNGRPSYLVSEPVDTAYSIDTTRRVRLITKIDYDGGHYDDTASVDARMRVKFYAGMNKFILWDPILSGFTIKLRGVPTPSTRSTFPSFNVDGLLGWVDAPGVGAMVRMDRLGFGGFLAAGGKPFWMGSYTVAKLPFVDLDILGAYRASAVYSGPVVRVGSYEALIALNPGRHYLFSLGKTF